MRPKRSTPKIMHEAGELRHIETPAEKKLWQYLRREQQGNTRFRRQHAIGHYITDFCALNMKLIIELDGTGYPQGLIGEQIPPSARLFAVIDVWDALCSDRPYRKAWSEQKALEYICQQTGSQFDPKVVGAFLRLVENRKVYTYFTDSQINR